MLLSYMVSYILFLQVKKVKHKHVLDHEYSCNLFQQEQEKRNKAKINVSYLGSENVEHLICFK